MPHQYVPRMINLESQDYQVVRRVADQRGLGEKGFSAALRMIIREQQEYQLQNPTKISSEEFHRIAHINFWGFQCSGSRSLL